MFCYLMSFTTEVNLGFVYFVRRENRNISFCELLKMLSYPTVSGNAQDPSNPQTYTLVKNLYEQLFIYLWNEE